MSKTVTLVADFQHSGFICQVFRHEYTGVPFGNVYFCGYVTVPKEHPDHGKDYSDHDMYNIDVHGGLTYDNVSATGTTFGFDTNHSFSEGITLETAIAETVGLAEQLAKREGWDERRYQLTLKRTTPLNRRHVDDSDLYNIMEER